ncbi:hypothetical protein PCASD_12222 [Puccinia coronata f. sp. avenae]|uniref:Uncharacterized protein n=1 Tax=Puccinia coronata f. sp. avenae TaxID=200324 RepID=A0A2N5TAS7_9BASI|nr:hypothetical protein PCASD_12222 [Puccinia coronata f. sp. avenae]
MMSTKPRNPFLEPGLDGLAFKTGQRIKAFPQLRCSTHRSTEPLLVAYGKRKGPMGACGAPHDAAEPALVLYSDDVVHYRPQRPGGPQDRPDLYGPFSQLAFPSHTIGSEGSLPRMLKPGCNLNQAFLVLAPSPKMQNSPGTSDTNDENRSPETAPTCHHRSSQLPSANSCERPATNDYSPCSPLHHDLRKLVDLHHHQQSPGRTDTPHLPRQSLRSTPLLRSPSRSHDSLDLRGLVGMDPNRLPDPPSSPFSEPFLDLIPFSSSSGTDPLDDFLGLF